MGRHILHVSTAGPIECSICGGTESAMPTECPGEPMPDLVLDAISAGALDFVNGTWISHAAGIDKRNPKALINFLCCIDERLKIHSALVNAAVALAKSESGTEAIIRGDPDAATLWEPWPEMDTLLQALDATRPGWRTEVPK